MRPVRFTLRADDVRDAASCAVFCLYRTPASPNCEHGVSMQRHLRSEAVVREGFRAGYGPEMSLVCLPRFTVLYRNHRTYAKGK